MLTVWQKAIASTSLLTMSSSGRLCRAGPYVVPFDGKESAVTNTIAQVLAEYTKNVTVLSYTVGAPVAYGPTAAPSSSSSSTAVSSSSAGTRRRLLTADGGCELVRIRVQC